VSKRKAVSFHPAQKRSKEEMAQAIKTDPAYPPTYVWEVRDNMGTVFADETAEGALALAKQYHRMKP
jgi:hypothetical protein